MAKYTLTKNYLELAETYGVLQNQSGDGNVEVTNDKDKPGIILKPFKTLIFNQKIFARKTGNTGTCQLAVLPFKTQSDSVADDTGGTDDESDSDDEIDIDGYDDFFTNHKPHKPPPLSVQETPSHYLVSVSKDSLKHQNKFLIQFDDKKR